LKGELEAVLGESLEHCRARESSAFATIVGANRRLVLFGAGRLGRKVLNALRGAGIEPIAFSDNRLSGQSVEGISVFTPAEAAQRYRHSAAFVVTIWASWADTMQQQMESLRMLGCRCVVSFIPLLWSLPELLPHVQIDLPSRILERRDEVMQCFGLWADEDSRREFLAQIRWRMFGDFACLNPPLPNQYWQADILRLPREAVFVDAGAFDGDTLAGFVAYTSGQFRAAYAFEPDPHNMLALRERVQDMPDEIRGRIHAFEQAVAGQQAQVPFEGGSGASSCLGQGDMSVSCVALDDTIPEPPHFIKYDIEGSELLGLCGTRRWVSAAQPSLAVCAYHLQEHIWQIPLLIHSFHPGYRYYLRPHGQIWETVCYAVPR
jgi:FkbM family methyltransferase